MEGTTHARRSQHPPDEEQAWRTWEQAGEHRDPETERVLAEAVQEARRDLEALRYTRLHPTDTAAADEDAAIDDPELRGMIAQRRAQGDGRSTGALLGHVTRSRDEQHAAPARHKLRETEMRKVEAADTLRWATTRRAPSAEQNDLRAATSMQQAVMSEYEAHEALRTKHLPTWDLATQRYCDGGRSFVE